MKWRGTEGEHDIFGIGRGMVLEARVSPKSFHDVLDDLHVEVSPLDFLLRAFDLQVHFSRD